MKNRPPHIIHERRARFPSDDPKWRSLPVEGQGRRLPGRGFGYPSLLAALIVGALIGALL